MDRSELRRDARRDAENEIAPAGSRAAHAAAAQTLPGGCWEANDSNGTGFPLLDAGHDVQAYTERVTRTCFDYVNADTISGVQWVEVEVEDAARPQPGPPAVAAPSAADHRPSRYRSPTSSPCRTCQLLRPRSMACSRRTAPPRPARCPGGPTSG
jgi:hypothetical protein